MCDVNFYQYVPPKGDGVEEEDDISGLTMDDAELAAWGTVMTGVAAMLTTIYVWAGVASL